MPNIHLKEDNIHALPLEPGKRDTIYWDTITYGLGLRVFYTGSRSYVVRQRISSGNLSHKSLGPIDGLTLQSARNATRYRIKKAYPEHTDIRHHHVRNERIRRSEQTVQCQYTKEKVHWFKTKRKDAKYCCQAHYHMDYDRDYYDNTATKTIVINPTVTSLPDVIYLPDETPERQSDIALLQHQLDQMEEHLNQIVEEKVQIKLEQIIETLTGNLLTILTTKLGD